MMSATAPPTKAQTVRPLELFELPLCLPFGEAFFRELDLPGTFNPDHFLTLWRTFLTTYPATILSLWDEAHGLVGGLGGMICPDLFTGDSIAQEHFWFIAPEARGGTGAVRLFRAFKTWGKASGATRMRMVHMMGRREERMEALYRGLGFRPIEVGWDLRL